MCEPEAEEGASLVKFKAGYPVLFDCLYSAFGAMLSNSRLCEQIHNMMRYVLRGKIGMEQADHQHKYCAGTDHEMNKEQQNRTLNANEFKESNKKGSKAFEDQASTSNAIKADV